MARFADGAFEESERTKKVPDQGQSLDGRRALCERRSFSGPRKDEKGPSAGLTVLLSSTGHTDCGRGSGTILEPPRLRGSRQTFLGTGQAARVAAEGKPIVKERCSISAAGRTRLAGRHDSGGRALPDRSATGSTDVTNDHQRSAQLARVAGAAKTTAMRIGRESARMIMRLSPSQQSAS